MECIENISSAVDLVRAFHWSAIKANGYINNKVAEEGYLVSTKVRKDCLTSSNCRKVIVDGIVRKIVFTNMNGGVWLAQLEGYKAQPPKEPNDE